ncbi:MAG: MraY family glycosyltransferase, partial [Desulfobacterales bacterium]
MRRNLQLMDISLRVYIPALIASAILVVPSVRLSFFDIGWRWFYVLLISFAFSFCLTPIYGWIARRYDILDRPDGRKMHEEATPLLGGLAVFSAFIIALLVNGIFSLKLGVILIAAGILCVVGVADDIKEIPAWVKLVAQFLCTALVMHFGIVLHVVPNSLGVFADIANVSLTVLWILGITNAMNFFDGMDGLAAGLGGVIAFFLGVVAFQTAQPFLGWVSAAMMGSCFGFLPHNLKLNKAAAIFLGDAGATAIGFVLACVAVYGKWSASDPVVALISPILIFWILIFDMTYISADRIIAGLQESFSSLGKRRGM